MVNNNGDAVKTMVRLTVQLPDELYRKVRQVAEAQRISAAEVIRRAVTAYSPSDRWERAMAVVGAFTDEAPDAAEGHDDYLAEALADA